MKTTNNPIVKKELTIEQKAQRRENYLNSEYYKKVINTNALLKQELKSFGAIRSLLLNNSKIIELSPMFENLLKKSKIEANYKYIISKCKTTKKGNYNVFLVLQCLNKFETDLQENFAKK